MLDRIVWRQQRAARPAVLLHRHRLGQIAWLVDVRAARQGRVVGQQLQGADVQDRRQVAIVLGQADDVQAFARADARIDVSENVQLAAAGAHFLHVRLQLFDQRVVRRDGDNGHFIRYQGQRAVFQFTGRICFGVDVRDFLELQGTFQRDRIVHAAAEEEGVFLAREFFRPGNDLRLQRQHGGDGDGQVAHGFQVRRFLFLGEVAIDLRQAQGQQEQARQLRRKSLGRGDAHFHAGARDVGQRAFAHHGAGGHIADGQGVLHAQAARMFQGGQGVGRLAALRNRHHQRVRVRHAVAVAVFAGHFHADGDLGDRFDPVLGRHARIRAGAAGEDQHAVDLLEDLVGAVAEQFRHDGRHAFQGVADGARLLEDFLLHVVAVRAQLGRARVRVHGFHFALDGLAIDVDDPAARQLQVDHVAFFQVNDLVGRAGQRHGVGGNKVFTIAQADDQGRALARGHHAVRFVAAEDGDRIRAVEAFHGLLHGIEQVAVVHVLDQVGDHFRVRLALEDVTQGRQFGAQLVVVFDDAVMHQRHAGVLFRRGKVGVRIEVDRRAMRGPARVRDARETAQAFFGDLLFQFGHARGGTRTLQTAIGVQRDAAGIVAAVLQAFQAFDQDGGNVTLRYRADDAAHGNLCLKFNQCTHANAERLK